MTDHVLYTIVASTRPGRIGLPIGQWVHERAIGHGAFKAELVDLAEVNLPMLDEPRHPRLRRYEHDHTRHWSDTVARADAFIFVVPEYNNGFNAPIKNAIDYLYHEWLHKPVGFVSYGGVSAGTRSVQMLKQVVTTLKMVPIFEAVNIPFVMNFVDDRGNLHPNDEMEIACRAMLDELARWTPTLRTHANAEELTGTAH